MQPPRLFSLRLARWLVIAAACGPPPAARAETLTLEDCLRETAAHNPLILREQTDIERAAGARLVLRARALPTLQIGGILGYQGQQNSEDLRVPVKDANGNRSDMTVTSQRAGQLIALGTGQLSQPIFDAAIPAAWRRGTVGVIAARQNYYTVASAQLYRARTQFYRALYQQRRGEVLRQIDDVRARNVQAQADLLAAGLRGRQGLLSAQVERANFATDIVSSAGSYRTDLTALLQTMGREPGMLPGGEDPLGRITLSGSLDEQPFAFDADAASKEALANRPDLLALREQIRAGVEDARITRGGYYPLIRLYVAGELLPENFVRSSQPNALRSSDQVQTTEVRPGVRGDWVVIDTGTVRGEARRLDALTAAVEINLRRLERDIPGELAEVRAAVDASDAVLGALRGNVATAQGTLDIVNAGLAQGLYSQLDFLEAQGGVLDTRLGLLDASLALSLARAEYDRVTGRYLHFVTDAPPAATATRTARK